MPDVEGSPITCPTGCHHWLDRYTTKPPPHNHHCWASTVASSSRRNEANDVGDTDATLVEGKTSWPDRWIRQTDFEAGIIYGILFPGETSRSRIMRKVFLSFLGKIGQVLEILINPEEARVGSEVSGLGKNFPSMVSIVHRQKSTSPPNL